MTRGAIERDATTCPREQLGHDGQNRVAEPPRHRNPPYWRHVKERTENIPLLSEMDWCIRTTKMLRDSIMRLLCEFLWIFLSSSSRSVTLRE